MSLVARSAHVDGEPLADAPLATANTRTRTRTDIVVTTVTYSTPRVRIGSAEFYLL